MNLGSGTVAIGNVGQSISLTNNTVSAGTTAAPVAVAAAANGRSGAVTWLIWALIAAAVVAARIMGG